MQRGENSHLPIVVQNGGAIVDDLKVLLALLVGLSLKNHARFDADGVFKGVRISGPASGLSAEQQ